MGRKIYLIRHAKPEMDVPRCIGITDVPLSAEGIEQAHRIAGWLKSLGIHKIYSSPLKRCRHTAEIISEELKMQDVETEIREDLHEVRAGEWEYLPFSDIKRDYPDIYKERGECIGYYVLPGGESFYQGGVRFGKCLGKILEETDEDILVVAHGGVITAFLCQVLGISVNRIFELPQSYVGVAVLEENEGIQVHKIGYHPVMYLNQQEIDKLYEKCGTPVHVIRHMRAVADYIGELEQLFSETYQPDIDCWCQNPKSWDLIKKAALVHDIARMERHHAEVGGDILEKEGYADLAELVRRHHSVDPVCADENCPVAMEELFFYADKRVKEDCIVKLEERFQSSFLKCNSEEARNKHRRLYEKSIDIEKRIEKITGGKRL